MPKWHLKSRNCRRSEIQQIEAPAGATRDSEGSSVRHRDLEPVRLLKAMSIAPRSDRIKYRLALQPALDDREPAASRGRILRFCSFQDALSQL